MMNISNTCFINDTYPLGEEGYSATEVALCTAGALALSTVSYYGKTLFEKNETGRRKICWAADHIATGLSCFARNLFHSSALKLGLGDRDHHTKQHLLTCERGTNALHKLRKRDERVYFLMDDKLLVKTVNQPKKDC